jgi:hypothetical protein
MLLPLVVLSFDDSRLSLEIASRSRDKYARVLLRRKDFVAPKCPAEMQGGVARNDLL